MSLEYLKNKWRRLDNTAKIFSLDDYDNINIFRYSVILKEEIDALVLKKSILMALDDYPSFKVKVGTGLFWNYLDFNSKEIIIEEEKDIPCGHIDFKENNDYLFKVSYFEKKINLDIFHVLTDGTGAIIFLKAIISHYLNLKYKLSFKEKSNFDKVGYEDQYLKNYNRNFISNDDTKFAYQIPGKVKRDTNNTYHYIFDVSEVKKICKKYHVTITEYLTAVYIFSLYKTYHKKRSDKEIIISVPVNLRKYYDVNTLSNFFVCMSINSRILEKQLVTFNEILEQVHEEFYKMLDTNKVKGYLTRDVELGTNIFIRLVPLFIKKVLMKFISVIASMSSTSTLSNVGIVTFDEKYMKYIDNVLVLVMPSKLQKIKCTICSFNNKLNVTINSNIDDVEFQKMFFKTLKRNINNIKLESNNFIDWSV